jgi:hypothetical protein
VGRNDQITIAIVSRDWVWWCMPVIPAPGRQRWRIQEKEEMKKKKKRNCHKRLRGHVFPSFVGFPLSWW